MKVVFFTGNLEAGGLERFVTRVSCYAAVNNIWEPMVMCLTRKSGVFLEQLDACKVPVAEAPPRWQRSVRQMLRLGRQLKEMGVDVVHTQVNFSLIQQWFATCCIARANFYVTERNMYPLRGLALWRRRLQFYFLKIAGGGYSANSQDVARHLSKLMWYPLQKIPVIPNGITVPPVSHSRAEEIRAAFGWLSNEVVIGYISRMASHKGQIYFLDIIKSLREQGMSVKACLVGDGPDRAALEKWVQENKLSSVVTFTGIISAVEETIGSFDICALLSDYEGMPNAVVEAMACGKVVVAHPVGNVRELLAGGAGIIVEKGDKKMALESFRQLILDRAKRVMMGDVARRRVENQFSIKSVIDKLAKLYGYE